MAAAGVTATMACAVVRRSCVTSAGSAQQKVMQALARFDVALIRHGNTGAAAVDVERELTSRGHQQAAAASASYIKEMAVPIAAVAFSSPASRCIDTLGRVLASHPRVAIEPIQEIYSGAIQPEGSALFARVGYAPLASYHAEQEATEYLDQYAATVLRAVARCVSDNPLLQAAGRSYTHSKDRERATLCIAGHAVYNSAVALQLAVLRGHSAADLDAIRHYNVQEACGFWVGESSSHLLEIPLAHR